MEKTNDIYNLIKIFDGAKPHCYVHYYRWYHQNSDKIQVDYDHSEIGTYFRPKAIRRSIKIVYRLNRKAKINHQLGDVLHGK